MKNNVGQLTVFLMVLSLTLHFFAPAEEIQNQSGFHFKEEKIVIPYIASSPRIDGNFDDRIYDNFLTLENFFQLSPKYNQPGSEKSEVFLGRDDKNFYLAVKAHTRDPKKIRATISKRDNIDNDDRIELVLDTFLTGQRGFAFAVNPYGIQMDGIFDEIIDENNMDKTWDTQFFSGGQIYDWGYFVEMKIPFKALRFPRGKDVQEWGFNITRFIQDNSEMNTLFYWDRNNRSWMSQEGKLSILSPVKPGVHLELVPYLSFLKNKDEAVALNSGFSFKYGINTDTTIDLTYNPDFSQIEADAGQININRRYPLYFDEKRPFFLEGKEIYKTPLKLFYSRRVIAPRFGVKVTAKSGKSSFGLFSAYDMASLRNLDDGEGTEEKALTTVFRYKYEFMKENYWGLIIADKRGKEQSYNSIIGLDAHLKHKNFIGDFQAVVSKTDQEEKRTGQAYYGSLSYVDEHFGAGVLTEQYSPGFDAQTGYLERTAIKRYGLDLWYDFFPEKSFFVQGGPGLTYNYITDWTGRVLDRCLRVQFICRTYKNTTAAVFLENSFERYEGQDFDKKNIGFQIQSAPSKYLSFGAAVTLGDGIKYDGINFIRRPFLFIDMPFLGYKRTIMFTSTIIPTPRVSILADWNYENFYQANREELVYRMNICRVKFTYLFNRSLSIRTIWEYNDLKKRHYGDVLLAYEYTPGTVFYLGYSSEAKKNLDVELNSPPLNTYTIYFKFSYFLKK